MLHPKWIILSHEEAAQHSSYGIRGAASLLRALCVVVPIFGLGNALDQLYDLAATGRGVLPVDALVMVPSVIVFMWSGRNAILLDKKSATFINSFLWFLAAGPLLSVGALYVWQNLAKVTFKPDAFRTHALSTLLAWGMWAAIWVPYVRHSKRINLTLLNRVRFRKAQDSPRADRGLQPNPSERDWAASPRKALSLIVAVSGLLALATVAFPPWAAGKMRLGYGTFVDPPDRALFAATSACTREVPEAEAAYEYERRHAQTFPAEMEKSESEYKEQVAAADKRVREARARGEPTTPQPGWDTSDPAGPIGNYPVRFTPQEPDPAAKLADVKTARQTCTDRMDSLRRAANLDYPRILLQLVAIAVLGSLSAFTLISVRKMP